MGEKKNKTVSVHSDTDSVSLWNLTEGTVQHSSEINFLIWCFDNGSLPSRLIQNLPHMFSWLVICEGPSIKQNSILLSDHFDLSCATDGDLVMFLVSPLLCHPPLCVCKDQ